MSEGDEMWASNSAAMSHALNSPVTYLFSGLGLMSLLVAAALLILACSYGKRPAGQAQDRAVEDLAILPLDPEPRAVVIMAGDDLPRFLAKPAAATACGGSQGETGPPSNSQQLQRESLKP